MTEKKSSDNPFEAFSNSGSSFFEMMTNEASMTSLFSSLTQEDQSQALMIASQIDVSNYEKVLHFGADVQQSLKNFTHNMLVHVQRNDTSPIREVLHKLMQQLEQINPDDLVENNRGFFSRLFKRSKSSIQEVVSQYNRLSKQIDRLGIQLQHAQKGLLSDLAMLSDLYRVNEEYFHNLTIYIAAGELKKQDLLKNDLPKLESALTNSTNPMEQQRMNDLKNSIEWLDKRIYDLQISREIAVQTAPQIRLIQQTNHLLVEKIQSSVMSTIPLWQAQIAMLVNMNNQRRANMTSERLMQTSSQMLEKNAKMIQATANHSKGHQGITHSDIDHFKETQLKLIESIEETLRVQAKSKEQQLELDKELTKQ